MPKENIGQKDEPRAIPRALGYCVYRDGRVVSNHRRGWNARHWHPELPYHPVKPFTDKHGYKQIVILRDGARDSVFIHSLVTEAYIGPRPSGMMGVRHLDGDPANNHISNLVYGTMSRNMRDRHWHGTMTHVAGVALKLTPTQVVEIRRRLRETTARNRRTLLSVEYRVSRQTIHRIEKRKIWKEAEALASELEVGKVIRLESQE